MNDYRAKKFISKWAKKYNHTCLPDYLCTNSFSTKTCLAELKMTIGNLVHHLPFIYILNWVAIVGVEAF